MAELEEAGSKLRILLIPMIAGIPAAAYLSGIGAAGAGGLLGLTSRTVQRAKDSGPVAQAAMVVGAVAAAGLLAVGSLAVARAVTGGSGEETAITTPGGAGDGSGGGGDGTGDGSSGSDASGGGGGTGGGGEAPAGSDAPAVTDAPPTAEPSVVSPGNDTTVPEDEAPDPTPPVEPETTTGPTLPPTTGATVPTVPTIPTTPPTTAPPPPVFSVGFGTAGPAYAGLGVTIPVTAGNAGSGSAVSLGPGRAAPPALAGALLRQTSGPPIVTIPLTPGVGFAGVDNAAWACSVASEVLQCVLPVLAAGASSEGLIQLTLDVAAGSTVTLTPTISDGSGPPVAGTPLVITVQPQPAGVSDLFVDRADLVLLGNAVLTCDPAAANSCVEARDTPGERTTGPGGQVRPADGVHRRRRRSDDVQLLDRHPCHAARRGGPAGPADVGRVGAGRRRRSSRTGRFGPRRRVAARPRGRRTGAGDRDLAVAGPHGERPLHGVGGRHRGRPDQRSGVYTVANLQTGTGRNGFGGWALEVLYRDPAAPLRVVALSDQIATVNGGGSTSVTLPGLAASAVDRPLKLGFAAVEGDFGLVPEAVSANGVALANPFNAVDNPFNSSISSPAARAPAFVNNFGFDVDQFAMTVAAGATEVVIDISSSQDRFRLGAVSLVVPL